MTLPKTFQTRILERFLSDKQMKDLYQEYQDNCSQRGGRQVRQVTDQDLMILHEYRKGATFAELSSKYRRKNGRPMSQHAIGTAIRIAALSKLTD